MHDVDYPYPLKRLLHTLIHLVKDKKCIISHQIVKGIKRGREPYIPPQTPWRKKNTTNPSPYMGSRHA